MYQLSTPPPSPRLQTMSCEKWLLILSSLSFPICDRKQLDWVLPSCAPKSICARRGIRLSLPWRISWEGAGDGVEASGQDTGQFCSSWAGWAAMSRRQRRKQELEENERNQGGFMAKWVYEMSPKGRLGLL